MLFVSYYDGGGAGGLKGFLGMLGGWLGRFGRMEREGLKEIGRRWWGRRRWRIGRLQRRVWWKGSGYEEGFGGFRGEREAIAREKKEREEAVHAIV